MVHSGVLALGFNMNSFREVFLKAMAFLYRNGTYYNKYPSPCLPEKEFLESELHIDKSTAFSPQFYEQQKTWKCGPMYFYGQVALTVALFVLITVDKQQTEKKFKKEIGPLFKHKKD